ncbi:MAG TPA: hypothetical protein VHW44_07100 [Pseudonocardiaceae bacterium]|nr:hypothetical protein [Pseudonocardiaceae bacterium]
MFYIVGVRQLSFYSAEASPPRTGDLAGVLCGPGQAVGFGGGIAARLTVVLGESWRARALVAACAQRVVAAATYVSEQGEPLVRTPFRKDLAPLAGGWLRDELKAVPERFALDGGTLRMWALVAGQWSDTGYLLGLDPDGEQTHERLLAALATAGLPAALLHPRGGDPAIRVTGARRLARLAELVGDRPAGVPAEAWPAG